jgi:aspartate oxidase
MKNDKISKLHRRISSRHQLDSIAFSQRKVCAKMRTHFGVLQTFTRGKCLYAWLERLNLDEAKSSAHLHGVPRSLGCLYKTIAPSAKDKNFSRGSYAQLGTPNRRPCKAYCFTKKHSKYHCFAFTSFLAKYVNI